MDGASANQAVVSDVATIVTRAASEGPSRMRNKNIAFFSQDISDISTIKRVHQFLARGFTTIVFGFRRDRYNVDFKPPWPHVLLGYTRDNQYLKRLLSLFAAVPAIWEERAYLSRASIFYARNLDQLALALIVRLFINPAATVVYEVLDIQPILARRGLVPMLLRAVERLCLRSVRYLVLSSPGFYRHYYLPVQGYRGAWLLLENKLPEAIASAPRVPANVATDVPRGNRPWVVGYFGLIRGEATVDLIARVARRLQGRVDFRFRGAFTTVDGARFRAALAAHPNIAYGGHFDNPADLAEMYGAVDFAWALDLENVDNNSRWLLPCRLYEAGYFNVPCLAGRGFELGNTIERRGIGWVFDAPFEDELVRFFETLTDQAYEAKRRALENLPASTFVSGADLDALSRVLADPEWAFAERHSVQTAS